MATETSEGDGKGLKGRENDGEALNGDGNTVKGDEKALNNDREALDDYGKAS